MFNLFSFQSINFYKEQMLSFLCVLETLKTPYSMYCTVYEMIQLYTAI
jgi:hypothetical protein